MENLYKDIYNIILKSNGLNDLIRGYYYLINNPIMVFNSDFQLVTYISPFLFEDETWNYTIKNGYLKIDLYKKIRRDLKESDDYKIVTSLSSNRRLIINLKDENKKIIGIMIILEISTKLEDISEEEIRVFSKLTSKILLNQKFNGDSITLNMFFMSLLNNVYKDKQVYLEKIKELNFDLRKDYYLLIFDFNHQYNDKNRELVENYFRKLFSKILVSFTYKDGYLVILISKIISNNEIESINDFIFKHHFYMIISFKIKDLYPISTIYKDEVKVLKLLEDSIKDYILYDLNNYLPLLPLISLNNEELLNFINKNISDIYHYDLEFKTNFLDTLYIYLVTNKSLIETSKRLFVHKNTITYRLEKIKELFGVEYDDYNQNIVYITSILIVYYLKRSINKIII